MLKETLKRVLPKKVVSGISHIKGSMRRIVLLCRGDGYFAVLQRGRREFSFSQNGEDLFIHRALRFVTTGAITYMDVGCNDPYKLNNTAHLIELHRVLKGVEVEPNPDMCKKIAKARPQDECLNIGLCVDRQNGGGERLSPIILWKQTRSILFLRRRQSCIQSKDTRFLEKSKWRLEA